MTSGPGRCSFSGILFIFEREALLQGGLIMSRLEARKRNLRN